MNFLYPRLLTLAISALPILELRVGIPLGRSIGLPLWEAFFWGVIGNTLPLVFILLWLDPVTKFLRKKSKTIDHWAGYIFEKTRTHHGKMVERFGAIGLILFVAIPLPGMGGWSGALLAFLFGIPYWRALLCMFLGTLGAGILVASGVESAIQLAKIFF